MLSPEVKSKYEEHSKAVTNSLYEKQSAPFAKPGKETNTRARTISLYSAHKGSDNEEEDHQ